MLYDRYMESRKKAVMSLDNYQIYFTMIIERMPIYVPYREKQFDYYKTLYNYRKQTGYNIKIPKELFYELDEPTYDRSNPDNKITHRKKNSEVDVEDYHENSRNWKLVDPTVEDPSKIQNCSADNVYFIVKNENGEWVRFK